MLIIHKIPLFRKGMNNVKTPKFSTADNFWQMAYVLYTTISNKIPLLSLFAIPSKFCQKGDNRPTFPSLL